LIACPLVVIAALLDLFLGSAAVTGGRPWRVHATRFLGPGVSWFLGDAKRILGTSFCAAAALGVAGRVLG